MLVFAKIFSVTFVLALIGLYEWPKMNRELKKERVVFVIICILTLAVSVLIVLWPRQHTPVEFILDLMDS